MLKQVNIKFKKPGVKQSETKTIEELEVGDKFHLLDSPNVYIKLPGELSDYFPLIKTNGCPIALMKTATITWVNLSSEIKKIYEDENDNIKPLTFEDLDVGHYFYFEHENILLQKTSRYMYLDVGYQIAYTICSLSIIVIKETRELELSLKNDEISNTSKIYDVPDLKSVGKYELTKIQCDEAEEDSLNMEYATGVNGITFESTPTNAVLEAPKIKQLINELQRHLKVIESNEAKST